MGDGGGRSSFVLCERGVSRHTSRRLRVRIERERERERERENHFDVFRSICDG